MRKYFYSTVLLGMLVAAVQAADKPTVDSILDRYVKEIGGKEAVEKTKTISSEGEIDFGGTAGQAKTIRKAPDKTGWKVSFDGNTFAQGYDGKRGWKQDPNGTQPLEGRDLRVMKRSAATPEETALKTLYPNLQYKGIETFHGEEAHILESAPSPTISDRLAFSTKTGLLIGRMSKDGDAKSVAKLGDYKKVEGVLRPHKMSESIESPDGGFEYSLTFNKITINGEIKDEAFAEPK